MIRALSRPLSLPRIDLLGTLSSWAALARQRRALARLDESALCDLGLTADMAQTEANRPFWDAPRHWRP